MIAIRCRRCDSVNLRKNGHTPSGQQKFHCKDCNAYGTLDTKEQERAHKQATVEKLHLERLSQRAIARTTGMSRMTVAAILKKALTPIGQSIHPRASRPILELDELWSFVGSKRHRPVGKETGETAHIERFNNTLRQHCANLVRRTLSFSKDEHWHEVRIRLFVDHYNRQLERTGCLASVELRPLPTRGVSREGYGKSVLRNTSGGSGSGASSSSSASPYFCCQACSSGRISSSVMWLEALISSPMAHSISNESELEDESQRLSEIVPPFGRDGRPTQCHSPAPPF